jgi:hypothetical protein
VHEPMRDTTDKKTKKAPIYEMIPRKSNISIDLNKPIVEEEQGLKKWKQSKGRNQSKT